MCVVIVLLLIESSKWDYLHVRSSHDNYISITISLHNGNSKKNKIGSNGQGKRYHLGFTFVAIKDM